MDWQDFVQWAFYGMMTGVATYGVHVLSRLQEGVENLNIKIAVVISQIDGHEKRLSRLEDK